VQAASPEPLHPPQFPFRHRCGKRALPFLDPGNLHELHKQCRKGIAFAVPAASDMERNRAWRIPRRRGL
jgi:hypothetical protein